jgi:hypothetical protein
VQLTPFARAQACCLRFGVHKAQVFCRRRQQPTFSSTSPENWLNRTRATSAMSDAAKRVNLPAGYVGRSLAADRRSKAKTTVKKGEGDRGDQRSD